MRSRGFAVAVWLVCTLIVAMAAGATPALAECSPPPVSGESHPCLFNFGSFTNPNGIAVDESTGDVYVAQLGTDERQTVSIEGEPEGGSFTLEFEGQKTSALTVGGGSTPTAETVQSALRELSTIGPANNTNVAVTEEGALPGTVTYTVTFEGGLASTNVAQLLCDGSALTGGTSPVCTAATTTQGVEGNVSKFDAGGTPVEFSALHSNTLDGSATPAGSFSFPDELDNPAAVAVDNSTSSSDPSRGALYVMDAGHDVIDKFNPKGEYLGQITGPTPATFSEPFGLGIDASGEVRVDERPGAFGGVAVDVFDNSAANTFITRLAPESVSSSLGFESERGFAVGPTGDGYALFSCGCIEKFGQKAAELGAVDGFGSTDVAAAVDQATGHLYIDDASSVTEWDSGEKNGRLVAQAEGTGTLVSTFGSLQLSSSSSGGIAVNSVTGGIYVSNPADGKVYVFATEPPGVTALHPVNVTQTSATLSGTVDPRGAAVSECQFEYGPISPDSGTSSSYDESVECAQMPGQIGGGTSPVPVSVNIAGLQAGRLYHFRLSAITGAGKSFSTGLFATLGPGFGIKNFEVSFTNEDGSPDTQAGSHPHQMTTNIEFNTTVLPEEKGVDSRFVTEPDGSAKDVIVDLPPGLVADPTATAKKCTLRELDTGESGACPSESVVGTLEAELGDHQLPINEFISNMVPPRGVALQFAAHFIIPNAFINIGIPAGGDYGGRAISENIPAIAPLIGTRLTVNGVVGKGEQRKPFLTLPTACTGPLKARVSVDSYQHPGDFVPASTVTHDAAGNPLAMTGCAQLKFPPTITAAPDVPNASTATGLTVGVHVSQTAALNPDGLAESALRDTTVTLPAGVAVNPAGADGLEACSEGLAGFTGLTAFNPEFEPGKKTPTFTPTSPEQFQPGVSFCPDGSKIGTVSIKSPLLENPLKGSVYLAAQDENPFKSLLAMYLIAEDPVSGTLIKLAGEVSLCEKAGEVIEGASCQAPGQIVTTFKNTPELPFEDLELHFFGGERAPLTTPDHCGSYSANATFTPWDGNGAVNTSSPPFQITSGPNGGPCPSGPLPFSPSLTAGSTNTEAGAFSPFTMTMSREDGQQNLQSVQLHMPPGLSGMLTGVELCPEPQASEGTCGPNSLIGETTVSIGAGGHPFAVKGGRVYLTGPYEGAPFGLSIVNPARAGPFDLEHTAKNHPACDCVLVRAKIEVDPTTAALTVTTDPGQFKIPTILEGIPLQIRHVNVTITRPGFTFNPTNCNKLEIGGALTSAEGASSSLSVPFQSTSCTALKFAPKFSASTSGKTSKAKGASLSVKLTYPKAPFGSQANIHSVKVELPKQLPSRLTTLQKACLDSVFNANPATCPAASVVGHATAITPILPVPLTGPAYFVSHGGARFPELIIVLQGYGVTVQLHGETFISKAGVTSSTFHAVPDVPVTSFELTLPEQPFSALAANTNLCAATKTVTVKKRVTVHRHGRTLHVLRSVKQKVPSPLVMPTAFTAQNGAVITQSTKIAVTGCGKARKKHNKATRHRKRRK